MTFIHFFNLFLCDKIKFIFLREDILLMIKTYFKYFLALLLFGLNGIVASHITMNSYEIVFTRTLIGSLFLMAIYAFSKNKLTFYKNKKHFLFLALSGIAMGTSWMFLYEAYSSIGVSLSSLAYYCGPVIVMAVTPLIFKEKLSKIKVFGFIIVLLGMLFVNGMELKNGGISFGLFCGIMSAIMYAFMVIFNKKAESITGLENSMIQLIISFLTVAVFVLFKKGIDVSKIIENIVYILILGILNTGVGCYFYFSSIQKLSATTVSVCGYIEPLSAVIFSVILLEEKLTFVQTIGAIFIIGGAILSETLDLYIKKHLE